MSGHPPAPRPASLVLLTGTATEIGKTWVGAAVLAALRTGGTRVAARKPAQSFEPGDDEGGRTDAQVLARATGEDATDICPAHRWYPVPLAPPMAADVLGRPPFTVADLAAEIRWPAGLAIGLVETAGGVRSPLAGPGGGARDGGRDVEERSDGDGDDTVALIRHLHPDHVVLVADAGLGTINAVRLATAALSAFGDRLVVHLNRYGPEDLHRRNRDWLRDVDDLHVTTTIAELAIAIGPRA